MPTRHVLVRCETSPGQFPTEFAVSIQLADGREISLFADEDLIEHGDQEDFIRVLAFDNQRDNEIETVLLPSEGFENGTRWANVRRQDIQ